MKYHVSVDCQESYIFPRDYIFPKWAAQHCHNDIGFKNGCKHCITRFVSIVCLNSYFSKDFPYIDLKHVKGIVTTLKKNPSFMVPHAINVFDEV